MNNKWKEKNEGKVSSLSLLTKTWVSRSRSLDFYRYFFYLPLWSTVAHFIIERNKRYFFYFQPLPFTTNISSLLIIWSIIGGHRYLWTSSKTWSLSKQHQPPLLEQNPHFVAICHWCILIKIQIIFVHFVHHHLLILYLDQNLNQF